MRPAWHGAPRSLTRAGKRGRGAEVSPRGAGRGGGGGGGSVALGGGGGHGEGLQRLQQVHHPLRVEQPLLAVDLRPAPAPPVSRPRRHQPPQAHGVCREAGRCKRT